MNEIIKREVIELTPLAIGSLLNTCSKQRLLNTGRSIHATILKHEPCRSDFYVQNHLLNFYSKCGRMACAQQVFDGIPKRNTVSWTALISGYDQCGMGGSALHLFSLMVSRDPCSSPNHFTYASALTTCAKQGHLAQGMQIHSHAFKRGFLNHVLVSNVLISLYMTFGRVPDAELLFEEILEPDEVSWNSLISGLSQNGFCQKTLDMFQRMRDLEVRVTSFALSAAIATCMDDENNGKAIHGLAIKMGLDSDCFPGSALIRMYSKYNDMEEASKVFRSLSSIDTASWNALIEGYGDCDQGEKGLEIFIGFLKARLKADEITIAAVLSICTGLVSLGLGSQLHSLSTKSGLECRIRIRNSMIDMYAKCGNLESGLKIFRQMEEKSVISWTSMMGGLAHHGRANEAMQLFDEMKQQGLKPNKVTYTCILSACANGRLVDAGQRMFDSMEIEAEEEHYMCMISLLVGGGKFHEAEEFIRRAPKEQHDLLWQSFLVACKNLGEWERAMEVADKNGKLDPKAKPFNLVLLSSVLAGVGRWKEVEKVRQEMKEKGMKKEPGCSWIEVDNRVQIFGMNTQNMECISTCC